jgi:hypothetical protein
MLWLEIWNRTCLAINWRNAFTFKFNKEGNTNPFIIVDTSLTIIPLSFSVSGSILHLSQLILTFSIRQAIWEERCFTHRDNRGLREGHRRRKLMKWVYLSQSAMHLIHNIWSLTNEKKILTWCAIIRTGLNPRQTAVFSKQKTIIYLYHKSNYGLDDRAIGVRSPAGAEDFSSNLCVQTGSGAQPASCTMGTGGPFPRGKSAAGAWRWPLTPI